jgi:hypothetical protein
VKPVDVLRDDYAELSRLLEPCDSSVHAVWLCILDDVPGFELLPPVLNTGILAVHEILIIHGLLRFPQALRATVILYA